MKASFRVAENFGIDLTSAKESSNTELKENLRSLSRMQESETEIADDDETN